MKNNDALKKHHFWILAGLAPFLTLLAVIMLMTGAGSAASSALEDQAKKYGEVKGVNPKGTKAAEDYVKQKEQLLVQREKLWQVNWEAQKPLFVWPGNNPYLKEMEKRYTKFGAPMVAENNEFDKFRDKEVYEAAYDQMAKTIAPTTFRGGRWQSVLRHVANWGLRLPTSDQIWLALEDIWVQRGLLQPIRAVNDEAGTFEFVPDPKTKAATPLKKTFRSRIWEVQLEVAETTEGPKKPILRAKLTNRTDRLQLLGVGNQMRMLVQLSPQAQPVLFRLESEFVKAGQTLDVKFNPRFHTIPPGTDVREIVSVRVLLDQKTAPIRRVESIDLGMKDARHFAAALKKPEFWKEPDPATAPAGGGVPMGGEMPMDGGADPGLAAGFPGGQPVGATRAVAGAKTGPPLAVLNGNRNRYIVETEQVRRMPVCVVLLVDQLFMQDALTAYANSALRFQITQFHWKRYRGAAAAGGGMTDSMGSMGSEMSGFPGMGSPGGDGAAFVDPSGMDMGGGFGDPMGFGATDAEGGYVLPPSGSFSPLGQTTAPSLTEGQDTSGLVELTIYGIVTIYKNYEKKDEAAPADGAAPEKPADPTEPAPAEGDKPAPAPTDADKTKPVTPATETPKQ